MCVRLCACECVCVCAFAPLRVCTRAIFPSIGASNKSRMRKAVQHTVLDGEEDREKLERGRERHKTQIRRRDNTCEVPQLEEVVEDF